VPWLLSCTAASLEGSVRKGAPRVPVTWGTKGAPREEKVWASVRATGQNVRLYTVHGIVEV
jgi:hypothetical protein